MRFVASGSFRHVVKEWGINFGPASDVDAEIPDSGGVSLRDLVELGEIPADCVVEDDEPASFPAEAEKEGF
jgi:hypothetical protein